MALITANQRLNLMIFLWFLSTSTTFAMPVIGSSGVVTGYILAILMAAVIMVVAEEKEPAKIKERLSSMSIWEILSKPSKMAVLGAYVGMVINTMVIGISSVVFFALSTLPVLSFAAFNPEKWKQVMGTGYTLIYLFLMLGITLYIAFNFIFTCSVAMTKGFTEKDFSRALVESLKGLTPRYFLLSLKPGLFKPSLVLTLIAVAGAMVALVMAVLMGIAGLPIASAFGAFLGVVLFHANIAFHYRCLQIMGLI